MTGVADGGIRHVESPLSEWGGEPRRDEQAALHRLLSSGDAVCADDPVKDRWVDTDPRHAGGLKILCSTCPVQQACLRYALDYDVDGVWGGTTAAERRRLRGSKRPEPVQFRPFLEYSS